MDSTSSVLTADERIALVSIKVERAKKHISDLHREIGAFLDSKPYAVVKKIDAGKVLYIVAKVTETPSEISAIVGDAIQNLRSALDHLMIQLLLVKLETETTERELQFPVRDTADKYKSKLDGLEQSLRKDAIDALRNVQAHQGGNGHDIWVLHRLNNIDKHRTIITAGTSFRSVNIGAYMFRMLFQAMGEHNGPSAPKFEDFPTGSLNAYFRPADNMCPLKVGDVLPSLDSEMNEQNDFRFDVAFNEAKIIQGKPILETLQHFADLVSGTIATFRSCLN